MLSRKWYRVAIAPLLLAGVVEVGCGSNEAPVFSQGPSAAGEEVAPGAPMQLSAQATDADGDALRYAWRQEPAEPAGTFSDAAAPSPTWTAPQVTQEASFQLVVRVSDVDGAAVEGSATVRVRPPAQPNVAPVVSEAASARPSPVTGRVPVQLGVLATDANNDALTYAWTQEPASPAGTFSDAGARTPTWTPPEVTAPSTFTLRVVASDGRGLSVQSEVAVEARPPSATNTAPAVEAPTASAVSVRAGDEVSLSVTASDTDGDALTYDWAQATPAAQGTFTSGKTTAQAKWYSPPVGADTDFTFQVTVRDGKGGEATKPVTVKVTVPKFAADIQPIFSVCTGCHNSTSPSGGMSLVATKSYANLVDVSANAACSVAMARVKPGDPANSALIHKVSGTDCGDRMPQRNPNYFNSRPGELVRLRSWILAGASND